MKTKTTLALTLLAAASTVFAGCAAGGRDAQVSHRAIMGNLSPELQGTHERPVDVDRNVHYTMNHEWRMFSDDLGRVFYTHQPTRLSPFPVISTTGNPW